MWRPSRLELQPERDCRQQLTVFRAPVRHVPGVWRLEPMCTGLHGSAHHATEHGDDAILAVRS
jgi:hypothetical protein